VLTILLQFTQLEVSNILKEFFFPEERDLLVEKNAGLPDGLFSNQKPNFG
jgi:hypothetical protein